MAHKTLVRNKAYQTKSFTTVERHNERKYEEYFNGDVEPERANLNVHFKRNFKENGEAETYQETFNRLLEEKKIVKHGTKPDATTLKTQRQGFQKTCRILLKSSADILFSRIIASCSRVQEAIEAVK